MHLYIYICLYAENMGKCSPCAKTFKAAGTRAGDLDWPSRMKKTHTKQHDETEKGFRSTAAFRESTHLHTNTRNTRHAATNNKKTTTANSVAGCRAHITTTRRHASHTQRNHQHTNRTRITQHSSLFVLNFTRRCRTMMLWLPPFF